MTAAGARTEPDWALATHEYFLGGERNRGNSTTFVDNMKLPVHRWYRYSAGYSSTWAAELIRHWGASRVVDPFAGSGTTLLAAQEVGAESLGVEVHPTVARIAQAKLGWQADPEELRVSVERVLAQARMDRPVKVPDSPLVAKCYPDDSALRSLLRLRDTVNEIETQDGRIREILWLIFVSIVRPTSPAGTAQWQYVLPNKTKSRVLEPFDAFSKTAEMFAEDMEMRRFLVGGDVAQASLLSEDARRLDGVPDNWADVVITSPPYANNYDYADALRLEQIVLGEIEGWKDLRGLRKTLVKSATQNVGNWNSREALESDILAPIRRELTVVYDSLDEVRKTRGGNKSYHAMLAGYFYDNAKVFVALRRVCAVGAKVCYVVGDSAPYGVHAPVEKWLGDLAVASGFKSWSFSKVRDRNTKWKNRKHDHPLHEGYLWIEG
ncbi:DNA methyltransferase [Ornithinimicrobium cerasi]|uniref:Methyltransferase n=1 Tax=Ornithinimicrobium cerasi TaxID=2248773 RepID=A0A285VKL1_9MICO|nr:DNA methyltransferase [Ornithinimicrobium cerasi]SOC53736.1 DNA methylase [Ornithinimicrobium cerasi]